MSWNTFEFTVVAVSLLELVLADVEGLSVLRAFRLVSARLFTLTFFHRLFPCVLTHLPFGFLVSGSSPPRLDVS